MGRYICTKKADNKLTWSEYNSGTHSDMENITNQYKYPEGTEFICQSVEGIDVAIAQQGYN